MIYKEISYKDYWDLQDQTGAYLILYPSRDKVWFFNGLLHREDGPAFERADGTKFWCLNGFFHREDGPAVEWANGDKEWWFHGKRHRIDGPAKDWPNRTTEWYLHGNRYETEEEWEIAKIKDLIV